MTTISDIQHTTIRTFCETIVPSIKRDHDPDGLWGRGASQLGIPDAVEQALLGMSAEVQAGMFQLLDGLAHGGFNEQTQESRELTLKLTGLAFGVAAQAGIAGLTKLVLFVAYGAADQSTGQNPAWKTLNYPGPLSAPPVVPKTITPVVPEGERLEIEADVVIVGSGAGGGVIAGELSHCGLRVVVVEAGQYRSESDFPMLEIPAFEQTYWRGGPQATANLDVSILAGATLGGGTVINWANCLRTTDVVRKEWAAAGLDDVATDFDRHLDAVSARIDVTAKASALNPLNERLRDAGLRLGWHTQVAQTNTDISRYRPEAAGYTSFGDQTGAKQSTLRTYLQDAFEAGAKILVGTTVDRVLVEDGRATGVVGNYVDSATGTSVPVTVRALQVVIAAGSLESPAILLRSGIGGPAVGQNLRLHPTAGAIAIFDDDVKPWWGGPHQLLVDEFERTRDYGFRLEGVFYAPGMLCSSVPFESAAQHKELIAKYGNAGGYVIRIRDHGSGSVTLDPHGQAQITYSLTDDQDVASMRLGIESNIRLLIEAGALEVHPLGDMPSWRRGDDLDAYLQRIGRVPLRFGGVGLFSAHQMGSCRMGSDPATSVADPRGQLHDTAGVWIGDASAFPTASGTNPMLSIMALAHRTSEAILQALVPAAAVGV